MPQCVFTHKPILDFENTVAYFGSQIKKVLIMAFPLYFALSRCFMLWFSG